MINSIKKPALWITLAALLISIAFAGCGSTASTSTSSDSGQKSSSSTQQSTTQSTQQQQGQRQDNSNMTAILNRAAEILGISSTKFTTAFQNAMPTQSGKQGQPPSDSANMTPPSGGTPPSGQQGGPPSGSANMTPPSGQQGQPPSMDFTSDTMKTVYEKMATELGISADKIQAALVQAQKELVSK